MDTELQLQLTELRETVAKTALRSELFDLTKMVKELAIATNQIVDRVDRLTGNVELLMQRQEQTDVRWNELIDMLARDHGNGKKS